MATAHKTTIELVVYSADPMDGDELNLDLEGIVWSIAEGDNIGDWTVKKTEVVEGDDLTLQLVAIGNDGRFFDDEDDEDDDA